MSNTVDSSERRSVIAPAQLATDSPRARRLQAIFWLVAIVLGLLHAWHGRYVMASDGISYLDMGDAYWRGDFQMAINGYWSPLYSWLLGLALLVIKPSSYWEFPVAHLVNFLIYLAALGSFTFFLGEVMRFQQQQERAAQSGRMTLPAWAWVVLGYTLFLWSSLELITLRSVTPDMCVAACVYVAAGLIVRIGRGESGWLTFAVLGVVLGVGYLAKAAMFPLAFVFMVVSLVASVWAAGTVRRAAVGRVAVAGVMFLLVSSPFLMALSMAKGRVTFGDSGRLNYAWYVADVGYRHWQGEPVGSGVAKHATRKVMEEPEVYEFGGPVGGTYPHWYDPSYWNEGLTPRFDLRRHIKNMLWRPDLYSFLLFALRGSLLIGLFILMYMSGRGWRMVRDVGASWLLLVPALAAFAMYMQVYVETRFIGSFFTLLLIGLFSSVRLPDLPESRRLIACVMIIIVTMYGLAVGPANARAAYATAQDIALRGETAPNVYTQVAEELKQMGVQPGDKVASLSYSNNANAYWARLARVQIVAELFPDAFRTDENDFWMADEAVKSRIIETFAKAGADIIVASAVPIGASTEGWQRIGNTDFYVYFLS